MPIINFAEEAFGSQNGGFFVPRQKFNFGVRIITVDSRGHFFNLDITRVSSVTSPSFSFDTQILNQYNQKRVVQTRINYDPVTISFYDTFDNDFYRFMRGYIEHYYNTGDGIEDQSTYDPGYTSIPINGFLTNQGFTPPQSNGERHYIKQIEINQRGYQDQDRVFTLHRPLIVSMTGDTLDYSDSNPSLYTVAFQPELVTTYPDW